MQFPQINLNGTDGKVLLEEYRTAYEMLDIAIKDLTLVTVHGRDYQTLGFDAYSKARDEHIDRVRRLEVVLKELGDIAINIQEQVQERSRG